jgi:predicted lipoprotein with Yx(FWY)xxD motif
MKRTAISAIAVGAAALAVGALGVASSGAQGDPAAAQAAKASGPKLELMKTRFGRILVNGRGRAIYLFTADTGGQSNCSGECAHAWPPYIVKRRPTAGEDVRRGLIGTVRRADGRLQVTYNGHPLYYYIHDNEPGEVLCQNVEEFGGKWYVVKRNGAPVL